VFGTVLSGRINGIDGAGSIAGPCMNTLPIRIRTSGISLEKLVKETHSLLGELLHWQHVPLAVAQRFCAGGSAPAFNTLFNYRHSTYYGNNIEAFGHSGIRQIKSEERTNYPITVSIDDLGSQFIITSQALSEIGADRMAKLLLQALQEIVRRLSAGPSDAVPTFDILSESERNKLLVEWSSARESFDVERLHSRAV